uniref:Uncharacterized protein n=1 Tax=Rhizophora mucronata TaxID=61149 RepID=A0A2P2PX11_RHIMU
MPQILFLEDIFNIHFILISHNYFWCM